jgi:hypothetical protein
MAMALAAVTVLTPAFVFLATSTLMAECVFTLAQVATVYWLERSVRCEPSAVTRHAAVAGLLAAVTTLVRVAGVATLAAGFLYLFVKGARRSVGAFTLAAACCLSPWLLYSLAYAPTPADAEANGGTIAYSYRTLLAMTRPGDPGAGRVGAGEFVTRVGRNLVNIGSRDVGGVLVPSFFRGPSESGEEVVSLGGGIGFIGSSMGASPVTMAIAGVLTLVWMVGLITDLRRRLEAGTMLVVASVAMMSTVGVPTFRYFLPLAPFLFDAFVRGLEKIADRCHLASARIVRLTLAVVLGLQLMDHAGYIFSKVGGPEPPDWLMDARSARELTDWMNAHLAPGAVASTNPGLVYLLTGRAAVGSDEYSRGWERWRRSGVRFIAALRPLELPPVGLGYDLRYRTADRRFWVVEMRAP